MPCSGLCQHRGSQYSPGIKEKSWLFPSGGFVCHVFISSGFIGEGVRKGSLKIHKRQVRINTQVFWNSSIISNIWKKILPNLFSCSTFCFGQTWLFFQRRKNSTAESFPFRRLHHGDCSNNFFWCQFVIFNTFSRARGCCSCEQGSLVVCNINKE